MEKIQEPHIVLQYSVDKAKPFDLATYEAYGNKNTLTMVIQALNDKEGEIILELNHSEKTLESYSKMLKVRLDELDLQFILDEYIELVFGEKKENIVTNVLSVHKHNYASALILIYELVESKEKNFPKLKMPLLNFTLPPYSI